MSAAPQEERWSPDDLAGARMVMAVLSEESMASLEEVEMGDCEQCENGPFVRWRYGRFVLCRRCVRSRQRAGQSSQDMPEPTPAFTEPEP